MSALSRIRENIGLVAIIIFIALLAFILTDFISGITTVFGGPPEAGTIAGNTITQQEFYERYNNAISNQGGTSSEVQNNRVKDQVWQQIVTETVFEEELDNVGLTVTGTEVYDMFVGNNINPYVQDYFRPLFEAQGRPYNPEDVKRYLDMAVQDENEAAKLRQFEEFLQRSRAIDRYLSMVQSGYVGSTTAAQRSYQEQNRKVDLSFLAVNYTSIPDSQVSVSDSELRNYMEENEDTYKQDAQTFIRFARFDLTPSSVDSAGARAQVMKLKDKFANTKVDSAFTSIRSRVPYTRTLQPIGRLPESIRDSLAKAEAGTVVGPLQEGGAYKLYKLVATEEAESPSAKIRHILITYKGNTDADTAATRSEAREVLREVNRDNFAAVAAEKSEDPRSRTNGGELGWYQKGLFGEDFDKAVSSASVGSIIGPIKGRGGFHVVEILDKTDRRYNIAQIEEQISYSTASRDSVYRLANTFAAKASQLGDINQAGSEFGQVNVFESNALTEETNDIQGLGGGREVVLWAINSSEGDQSKVFRVGDSYVFAAVNRKVEEGLQPLEEVRDEVAIEVRNQKKAEMIKDKLASLAGQDLNAMKDAYGPGAFVNSAQGISFQSQSIPGIGADRFIIGYASGMEVGKTSPPLTGDNGVFVLQATNVTEAAEADENTLASTKNTLLTQGQMQLQNKVQPALVDLAEVEDNRAEAEAKNFGFR
jgi:peptidyl-prolyl cis-trans isomerase D